MIGYVYLAMFDWAMLEFYGKEGSDREGECVLEGLCVWSWCNWMATLLMRKATSETPTSSYVVVVLGFYVYDGICGQSLGDVAMWTGYEN